MRIVIIDDSGPRATVLEEGLREAGYDDIHIVPPRGAFVARLERMAPDVVLMDLGSPSRDTLEEMLTVSRAAGAFGHSAREDGHVRCLRSAAQPSRRGVCQDGGKIPSEIDRAAC